MRSEPLEGLAGPVPAYWTLRSKRPSTNCSLSAEPLSKGLVGLPPFGEVSGELLSKSCMAVVTTESSRTRLYGGRTAKRWFRECTAECADWQAALQWQDTHAPGRRRVVVNISVGCGDSWCGQLRKASWRIFSIRSL